jgi:acetyl-CoA C-acetyltransferase
MGVGRSPTRVGEVDITGAGLRHVDPRAACVIGVAQLTSPPADGDAPEPLELWASVAAGAAADSGAPGVLAAVERLDVVYCQSWQYDDPSRRLADRLGIEPSDRRYSGIGGTTPQLLVGEAARAIGAGDLDLALVVGAEALDTRKRLKRRGARPDWSFPETTRSPFPFEAPFHPAELAHDVFQAYVTFALWDVARRAHLGLTPAEHRASLGELFSPMTAVAARNPYAWFPKAWSAVELSEPTADNRMVAYPYTKRLVSVMDVDQAAAVIVASEAAADRLGVPRDRRVYLRGCAGAYDPTHVAAHEPMWASPAMASASSAALTAAGVDVDDVAHLELYSCFPSSVSLALDALGVGADDGRDLTVTGGLPYAGGPGSCYLLHAIATMTDVLRHDDGSVGLVSGVGMHLTKHVYAAYSTTPPPAGVAGVTADSAGAATSEPRRAITDVGRGPATMATYTVVHGRDGLPEWGLAVCDLPDGTRTYARVTDADLCQAMEDDEWVGRAVQLVDGGERNGHPSNILRS